MDSVINQAIAALQQGNWQQCIELCRDSKNKHPVLSMVHAIALGKSGNLEQADQLFRKIKQEMPQNPDLFFNHGLLFYENGLMSEAKSLLQQTTKKFGNYFQAWHATGNVYLQLGEVNNALSAFERAYQLNQNNPDYLRSCVNCTMKLGQYGKAIAQVNRLIGSPVEKSQDYVLLLNAIYRAKLGVEYAEVLHVATKAYPKEPDIHLYAGLLAIDLKQFVFAEKCLQFVAEAHGGMLKFETAANLAFAKFMLGKGDNHLDDIESALAHEQTEANAVFVVDLMLSLGLVERAQNNLDIALSCFSDSIKLMRLNAQLLQITGLHEQARDCYAKLLTQAGEETEGLFYDSIKVWESLNDYANASKAIKAANNLATKQTGGEPGQQFLADLKAMEKELEMPWRESGLTANNKHRFLFIVGFPRSGTTLLESRLAKFEETQILEETHALEQFVKRLQKQSAGAGIYAYLNNLSSEALTRLADSYMADLEHYMPVKPGYLIVDKMPMNGINAYVIKKLFPASKTVVMTRRSEDVAISCLKQQLIQIHSESEFALCYSHYFQFLGKLVRLTGVELIALEYEKLVSNFEEELQKLLTLLAIDSDAVADKLMLFNTPSNQQVAKSIYTSSIGIAERYKDYFALPSIDSLAIMR